MKKIKLLPFYIIAIIPLTVLYFFSDIIYLIVFYLLKYRRKVVLKNLIDSFPLKTKQELSKIEKEFYHHLCDMIVESISILGISEKNIKKRLKITNPEMVEQYQQEGKSIILYTAHFGNWEWISFFPLYFTNLVTAFYQPLSSKYFDEIFKTFRTRFGLMCIENNTGYRTLLKLKNENKVSLNIMAGDQSPRGHSTKHWVNFLNQDTTFLIGAETIAKKSNQVVLYPHYTKTKRGHYEITLQLISDTPTTDDKYQITEKYTSLLEQNIISSPHIWLWSHKRWKLNKEEH